MDRRQFLLGVGAVGTLGTVSAAGCIQAPGTPTATALRNPSFEDRLAGWTVGTDLPMDPNTGDPVAARADTVGDPVSHGERSLSLFIDGRQDDGTIWVQQAVDLSGTSTLSVDVYSEGESFNTVTKLAVYAGPDPGRALGESDFDTTRATETHEGWATQSYPVRSVDAGLLAVGISVVWETEVTRFLDAIRLG